MESPLTPRLLHGSKEREKHSQHFRMSKVSPNTDVVPSNDTSAHFRICPRYHCLKPTSGGLMTNASCTHCGDLIFISGYYCEQCNTKQIIDGDEQKFIPAKPYYVSVISSPQECSANNFHLSPFSFHLQRSDACWLLHRRRKISRNRSRDGSSLFR